ncbi:MAG: hypothetical protein RE471_07975 [Ferroplasma sp.]|nr:hypothetical protein [Ferroplasma sp.]WMT50904.1 MAG: hypothetical protein RE471_07975 [Ferroplasma sp.]
MKIVWMRRASVSNVIITAIIQRARSAGIQYSLTAARDSSGTNTS